MNQQLRPSPPQNLEIDGPAGSLEAMQVVHPDSNGWLVICHPHPVFGGTMHNKVVHTLARAGFDLGLSTVRFNFRGVGASAGEYDEGIGETQDCLAVLDWATKQPAGETLWLAGFSFGGYVALRAVQTVVPQQLITVAPPVQRFAFAGLEPPECPWLIIQGDDDELVDSDAVIEWVNGLPPGPELAVMDGVDHFFHGRLIDLRELIVRELG